MLFSNSITRQNSKISMNAVMQTVVLILLILSLLIGCAAEPSVTVPTTSITAPTTQAELTVREWLDIPYASQSAAQMLDIHLPATGNGPFPVIISVHGGGFMSGDKKFKTIEMDGVNRGYAVVCVNYRLSAEAIYPAAVYDVKAAVRFIKANAGKYSLNAEKIGACGASAGGNLVSMLGTTAGVAAMEDLSMGNSDQTSNIQAVVDLFGPITFLTLDAEFVANGMAESMKGKTEVSNGPGTMAAKYFGAAIETIPDLVEQSYASNYISADDPPFLLEHGTIDNVVPQSQSINFAAALEKILGKDKVTFVSLEGAGHGTDHFKDPANVDKIFAFFDQYLK